MTKYGTIHLSRLLDGTVFVCGDTTYTLVDWNECSATVRITKAPKLVSLTDRYGNDREFYADQGSVTRITSDLMVEVEAGTRVMPWGTPR